jgi:hypothetical protein
MKKLLIQVIYGPRAKGEPIPQPRLKTTAITDRPSESDWLQEFKVGSRYGYRGSFYSSNPAVIKLK